MFLLREDSGASFPDDSGCGRCLSRTASVSACAWDVDVGNASVGVGRGWDIVDMVVRRKK
jgi:hypothetical protein